MPEIALIPRPALPYPPRGDASVLLIEPLPEDHVLHVLAATGAEVAAERLAALSDGTPHAVRPLSPGQWLVVGEAPLDSGALKAKVEAIGANLAVSDQSHGRVRLALAGPQARFLLAKGSAVDFSPAAFPVGHATPTLFNHVGIHVTRTGEDRFELLVLRSFAQSLWEELLALSADLLGRERSPP